uniref:Uncharacterized protein n=1 Tax=Timema cristinae TaxID=61476 RepID=A0A7R9D5E9_TIMCR|nr:unnamed protein product [Timema cristinae]
MKRLSTGLPTQALVIVYLSSEYRNVSHILGAVPDDPELDEIVHSASPLFPLLPEKYRLYTGAVCFVKCFLIQPCHTTHTLGQDDPKFQLKALTQTPYPWSVVRKKSMLQYQNALATELYPLSMPQSPYP